MSQTPPLREQLKALVQLQEVDLKIDQLRKQKAAIPVAMKAAEDALGTSGRAVDAKRGAMGEIEKLQRQAQAALDLNRDRLARANAKLEEVHNTHEFEAATKEVESLKKMGLSLEEQIKKSEGDLASARSDLDGLQGGFDKNTTARDEQAAEVADKTASLDRELAKLAQERGRFAPLVEKRILTAYDRVRLSKNGVGVAPAHAGRCGACNMMLPAQQFNEVQRGTNVQTCTSCNRVLFLPEGTTK